MFNSDERLVAARRFLLNTSNNTGVKSNSYKDLFEWTLIDNLSLIEFSKNLTDAFLNKQFLFPNVPLGKEGIDLLNSVIKKRLELRIPQDISYVNLQNTSLVSECTDFLVELLSNLSQCAFLNLSNNKLDTESIRKILDVCRKLPLINVDVSYTGITAENMVDLKKFIKDSKNLSRINLSGNPLTIMEFSSVILETNNYVQLIFDDCVYDKETFYALEKPKLDAQREISFVMTDKMLQSPEDQTKETLEEYKAFLKNRFQEKEIDSIVKATVRKISKKNQPKTNDGIFKRPSGRVFSYANGATLSWKEKALYDNRFFSYNICQFADYFLCEGPSPLGETVQAFLEDICFNQNCQINTIIVIGQPNANQRYYDYFSQDRVFGGIISVVKKAETQSTPGIKKYQLEIKKKTSDNFLCRNIDVYCILNTIDDRSIILKNSDIKLLYDILISKKVRMLAHCATGLGLSAALLLSFYLFGRFSSFLLGTRESISGELAELVLAIKKTNPDVMYNLRYQLKQTVQLALTLKTAEITYSAFSQRIVNEFSTVKCICLMGYFEEESLTLKFLRNKLYKLGFNVIIFNVATLAKKQPLNVEEMCIADVYMMDYNNEDCFNEADAVIVLLNKNNIYKIQEAVSRFPEGLPKICITSEHDSMLNLLKINSVVTVESESSLLTSKDLEAALQGLSSILTDNCMSDVDDKMVIEEVNCSSSGFLAL